MVDKAQEYPPFARRQHAKRPTGSLADLPPRISAISHGMAWAQVTMQHMSGPPKSHQRGSEGSMRQTRAQCAPPIRISALPSAAHATCPIVQTSNKTTEVKKATWIPDKPSKKVLEVFGTVELLEHILSYLSTKTVARSQRVQKHWRDVIEGSTTLRRIIFLEAVPESAHERLVWISYTKAEISTSASKPPRHFRSSIIAKTHPAISKMQPSRPSERTNTLVVLMDVFEMLKWTPGQWREALLTQPPCHSARYRMAAATYQPYQVVQSETGVTLGDLFDEFAKMKKAEDDKWKALGVEWQFSAFIMEVEAEGLVGEESYWVKLARGEIQEEEKNKTRGQRDPA